MNTHELAARAARLGIDTLNPMQAATVACKADCIELLAPTGSGKTLAFALAMLARLHPHAAAVTALVVTPTRELARQVSDVLRRLAPELRLVTVYGGHRVADETASLAVVPDIVVGTPGRIVDHCNRHRLDLAAVEVLVLDEFDKSLELGFATEMHRIVQATSRRRATILTSATAAVDMPQWLPMQGAACIDYTEADTAAEAPAPDLQVLRVESPARDKLDTLGALVASLLPRRTIVFVNHRESADRVFDYLKHQRVPATLYHGGLEQTDRERALITFGNGTTPVLVATDLAARGLDIEGVDAVVHYHLPLKQPEWTHRNGRTGRQGASGSIYVITSEVDKVPDFITFDATFTPEARPVDKATAPMTTLYFDAGRREKISRGDLVGFLTAMGIPADAIGRIDLCDHAAYAAVRRGITLPTGTQTIKRRRVRVSVLK